MKTAAKVFLIIGMVLQFYFVLPIIFGAITISKINNARYKSELTGWGVVSIIFVSVLGGIFTLCIPGYEFSHKPQYTSTSSSSSSTSSSNSTTFKKLADLKSLYDDGIIDEATYNEKRQKYLREI